MVKQFELNHQRWNLLRVPPSQLDPPPDDCKFPLGDCDPPTKKNKAVRLNKEIDGQDLMEAVLHECGHGRWWDMDEDAIAGFAEDMTRLLYRLGYRRVADEQ